MLAEADLVAFVEGVALVDAVVAEEAAGEAPPGLDAVDAPEVSPLVVTEVVVAAVGCRAMPSPRALATPMLSEATSARLREAGCGRFVVMGRNVGTGCEPGFGAG